MSIPRILKQGSWYLLGNLATRAAFLAGTLLFTRLFAPDAFGAFVLVKTAVVFAAVLDTWLIECVMRFHPAGSDRETQRRFARALLPLAVLQGLLATGVAAATLGLCDPATAPWVRFVTILYLLDFTFRLNLQLLRVRGRVAAFNGYSFAYAAGRLGLSIVLVMAWQHDIRALLWAWIAVGAGLAPVMSLAAWRRPRPDGPVASAPAPGTGGLLRPMVAYGLPLVGLALGWTGLYLADRFMLQVFRGTAEVGLYGVLYSVAELAHFLPYMLISFPAYPALVSLYEADGLAAVQDQVRRLARPWLLLALPMIAGLTVLAPRVLSVCTPPAYAAAAGAMAWLAPGLLAWGLLAFFNIPFMLLKRTRLLAALGLGALLLNILLNLAVVHRFGLFGAAAATSATYLLLAAGAWWTGARVLGAPIRLPGRTAGNAMLAAAGMVLVLRLPAAAWPPGLLSLGGLILAGVAVYGAGLFALRELTLDDWQAVSGRRLPRGAVRA